MTYKNNRNIEKIMNLYSALADDISNTISFEAVCNLDDFEIMSLSLYAAKNKEL